MLQCTMASSSDHLKFVLEDLLVDLWQARRVGDLRRLALLTYCDLRCWARIAQQSALAERSWEFVRNCPYDDCETFLVQIDSAIAEAEHVLACMTASGDFNGLLTDEGASKASPRKKSLDRVH